MNMILSYKQPVNILKRLLFKIKTHFKINISLKFHYLRIIFLLLFTVLLFSPTIKHPLHSSLLSHRHPTLLSALPPKLNFIAIMEQSYQMPRYLLYLENLMSMLQVVSERCHSKSFDFSY